VKILQLCLRVPFPPADGGSIAIYNLQRSLLKQNASLKVLAFNTIKHYVEPDTLPDEYVKATCIKTIFLDNRVKPFAAILNLFTGESYNIVRFIRRDFDDALTKLLTENTFDIIQIESLFMVPYLETIRRLSKAKVVLRAHNIEHLIWDRMARQETNPLRKWYLGILSKRLRQYEVWSLNRVDAIAAMTAEDEKAIRELGGTKPVYLAPIGMNTGEYLHTLTAKPNVVFHLGAMDWLPNQEGIEWLLEKVWPELRKIHPNAQLKLAGRNMPQRFLKYNSANCSIEDFVNDGKTWMAEGSVMAVPLFSGSGMRVKILEGMALGRPVVTTPVGIEGIPAQHGKEVMITDEPVQFANHLAFLMNNPEKAAAMGKSGKELVSTMFDNDQVASGLLKFYAKLASNNFVKN
jgi:glycosyltransferase involved in cell wall biosynthesis